MQANEPQSPYTARLKSVENPWAKVPMELVNSRNSSTQMIRVYAWLDFMSGRRGFWYGRQTDIADALGIGISAVKESITKLRSDGFIETQQMGIAHANILRYFILARITPIEDIDEPVSPDNRLPVSPEFRRDASRNGGEGGPEIRLDLPIPQTEPQTEPQGTRKRATRITDDYIEELVAEFSLRYPGGEAAVRANIDRALNHKASTKWLDKRRGLRDWLSRDAMPVGPRLTEGQTALDELRRDSRFAGID